MEPAKEIETRLTQLGFERILRDDRLYDILPRSESKEKGVELWEKEEAGHLFLIRLRQPVKIETISLYKFPVKEIESHLLTNTSLDLAAIQPHATGEKIFQ